MSYQFEIFPKMNIGFRTDYVQAYFGYFHIAFLNNVSKIVLPSEDRKSVEVALHFYQKFIENNPDYPVISFKSNRTESEQKKEILKEVLGIPDVLFNQLDLSKDILPQLTFADGLFPLKKECYTTAYQKHKKRWYIDDFKLYCLCHGFYFLYDETKPFISDKKTSIPVYIDSSMLDDVMKELYETATSDRINIDFVGDNYDSQFADWMKKFDAFDFNRRLNYFVNDAPDEEIEALVDDLKEKKRYTNLLKKYLSSMINVLYDDYCFTVLNKVTVKTSFMSVTRVPIARELYSVSSYAFDLYSMDRMHWVLPSFSKNSLERRVSAVLKEHRKEGVLSVYSRLGLPYPAFTYVKDLQKLTTENFLSVLPFDDILSESESFFSSKRYDEFYSFLTGEKKHDHSLFLRMLSDYGIEIRSKFPMLEEKNGERNEFTIRIRKAERTGLLNELIDSKSLSLLETIYPTYSAETKAVDIHLTESLKIIDQKSKKSFIYHFFRMFDGTSIEEVVNEMLFRLDLQNLKSEEVLRFFIYLFHYPLEVAEHEYNKAALFRLDTKTLMTLDGLKDPDESFEPNLPYPYVTFGSIAYGFRREFFSKPYLCSCQKECIEQKIDYLIHHIPYYLKEEKSSNYDRNLYVLQNIGLPVNIQRRIDPNLPIAGQIPYQDHLCHLCNSSGPSIHENVDDNQEEPYNLLLTYIRANSCLHGVFFNTAIDVNLDLNDFVQQVKDGTFTSLCNIDVKKTDQVLSPYIDITEKKIMSMLCAFFVDELYYDDYLEDVVKFVELGENQIRKLMFDCKKSDYDLIYRNFNVFTRLVYLYKMIEISYAIYVSQGKILNGETEFSLNCDYAEGFPYPYVYLGKNFNAYSDVSDGSDFYMCECDKEGLTDFLKRIELSYAGRNLPMEYKSIILLSMCGLPYQVVWKLADYDFSTGTVEGLISQIKFRDSICRRCLNKTHSAYTEPFRKAFPFKENLENSYAFSANKMIHEGFYLMTSYSLDEIVYKRHYRFRLNANFDNYLPVILLFRDTVPERVFSFFNMNNDTLNMEIQEFMKRNSLMNQEVLATSASLIMDTHVEKESVILDFLRDIGYENTFRTVLEKYFPEISRVREALKEEVMQCVLGFMVFLFQKFIKEYALDENYIGK